MSRIITSSDIPIFVLFVSHYIFLIALHSLTVSAAKSSGYNVDNGDILLIALKYHDEASANPDSLWWTSNPDGGWIKGASANNAQTISSYEVVDRFIEYLNIDAADSFTNLQETVLLGHSAGGQLVCC